MPQLRRAPDDRPDEHLRGHALPALRQLDAAARLMSRAGEAQADELFGDRRVAPSILSADFSRLGAQVAEVMDAGARVIHVDVMDGHFVPPITIGPLVAGSIADQVHDAGGAIDVHLMIERPATTIAEFARAGADCITFHFEADPARQPHAQRDPRGRLPGRPRAEPGDAGDRGRRARPRPPTSSSACPSTRAGAGSRSSQSSPDKVAAGSRSRPWRRTPGDDRGWTAVMDAGPGRASVAEAGAAGSLVGVARTPPCGSAVRRRPRADGGSERLAGASGRRTQPAELASSAGAPAAPRSPRRARRRDVLGAARGRCGTARKEPAQERGRSRRSRPRPGGTRSSTGQQVPDQEGRPRARDPAGRRRAAPGPAPAPPG